MTEQNSPNHLVTPELISRLVELARCAGDAIMAIYVHKDSYQIEQKLDESPLTAADLAAHKVITAGLAQLLPLPLISEEGELADVAERHSWDSYWLVDPLDGTKEFIAGNGQFTVNIALIHRGRPILGVVHVPASDTTYWGVLEASDPASRGAFKSVNGAVAQAIHVRSMSDRYQQQEPFTVLLSHRHNTQATLDLMQIVERNWPGVIETTNAGSSLKFCVIAEGLADFYPRLAPTSEWDTAAAQAVLEAAGGLVTRATADLESLVYNDQEGILNPHFYALGDKNFHWEGLFAAPDTRNS
jgi:3'(2'), 5'-bisphosphate nucleotidase